VSVDQFGIHIGGLNIHFYALILITGMFAAALLTARRARLQGLDEDHVWNGLMWAIIPGLLGARLYHVFTPSPASIAPDGSPLTTAWYFQHPFEIFAIWNGGLGIYGAIVGGAIGVYIYARRHKQPFLRWLDITVPGLALAQAIGRWGNYVNQELYGAPTQLPWAIPIPLSKRLPGYEQFDTFHPLFLYESIWNLATCGFLLLIERKFRDRLRDGDLLLLYLMCYATIRFILDFVRLDSNGFGKVTTAQIVSLVTFFGAAGTLFMRHRTPAGTPSDASSVQTR
jgi:phosphatidylglycerol:prolipoprotein diacylglycerol transferase